MKETRAQIGDIQKQIRDCKDARKSISDAIKTSKDQIRVYQQSRARLSATIKSLVNSMLSIQTLSKESRPKRKNAVSIPA